MYICVEALGSDAVERIVPLSDPGTRESLRIPLTDELMLSTSIGAAPKHPASQLFPRQTTTGRQVTALPTKTLPAGPVRQARSLLFDQQTPRFARWFAPPNRPGHRDNSSCCLQLGRRRYYKWHWW